jgi:peroxiredoxin
LSRQIKHLATFVADEAKGDDRWNGRLMLADLQLASGDRKAAAATLKDIDDKAAPALLLVTAATMAQHLELTTQRDAWIGAALGKEAPLPDRLAMARVLTTVLNEVERGEGVFTAALAAASTDEEKALVRWHRADALRDREDLPENAAFQELEKLAADLPKTYWGDVAKDRLRRTTLKIGDEAIPFRAITREHGEITSESLRGKTVVLVFLATSDLDTPKLLEVLRQLQKICGDKLAILGVCLDREEATIAAAVKNLRIDFPLVGDGKGIQTDVALRWFAEGPVVHVIDANGKVAGLGLHAGTADGRAELQETVERAARN